MRLSWENEVISHWSSFVLRDSWTCPWSWLQFYTANKWTISSQFFLCSWFFHFLNAGWELAFSAVSLLQFYNSFLKNSYAFWNLLHCSEGLFSDLYSHYYPLYGCNKDQQRWQAAHSLTQYAYFPDESTMRCPSWRPRPLELHLLVMSLCFVWACVKPAFIVVLCRRLSLSRDKVHARKDAHSNLLSKKETSSLYKIQCKPHFAL